MELKHQVYPDDRVENAVANVERESLSKGNCEYIRELATLMSSEGYSDSHIATTVTCLSNLAPVLDFDLLDASESEVRGLVADINKNRVRSDVHHGVWTRSRYKMSLRVFYREFDQDDSRYGFIKVQPKKSETEKVTREELLNVREVERLVNAASTWRDKAFIGCLWDSGMRISEILTLRWRDITFGDDLVEVRVKNGKNGQRVIYLAESGLLLKRWKERGFWDDARDPVWCPMRRVNTDNDIISRKGIVKKIKKARSKTDIPEVRRTNPHAFRKARATCMASRGMTQPNMNGFFGWVPGSTSPVWYIQLAHRDVEKSIRRMYDLPIDDEEYERVIGPEIPEYSEEDIAELA